MTKEQVATQAIITEILALRTAYIALTALDDHALECALTWLNERLRHDLRARGIAREDAELLAKKKRP